MNSSARNSRRLALETDLPMTPEDVRTLRRPSPEPNHDLASYLMFLETIGAFRTRKTAVKIYPEEFTLE